MSASVSGTRIPPAVFIIDSANAAWTLANGIPLRNGVQAHGAYNATEVSYWRDQVYHHSTNGHFYVWSDATGGWSQAIDPSLGGLSVDGAALSAYPALVDKWNNVWTVQNNQVYINGAPAGVTSAVMEVMWVGGRVYHKNAAGDVYVAINDSTWLKCAMDPRTNMMTAPGLFYGMNGHFDYLYTPSQVIAMLKDLGCTTYRSGCCGSAQISAVALMAKAFQSAGMTLVVLLDEDVMINGQPFANEQAAYDHGFATGVATAAAMAPYGVKYFECGNEFTRKPSIIVDMGYAGTNASDFQNANWYGLRGVVRGMRDGIKSVTPDAKCLMNFTVNDIAAADMLWEGTQPDGSTGHPTFRWDVTSWHNYAPYGDIFNQGVDGAGPGYNIPSYCKARYGVPFMITEWNSDDVMIETDRAAYVTARLTEMYRHRNVDGLLSVMYYDLDSGNETYGIVLNGVPLQPTYGAFQAVVAANPDK